VTFKTGIGRAETTMKSRRRRIRVGEWWKVVRKGVTYESFAANATVSLTVKTPRRASSCSTKEKRSSVEKEVVPLTVT